MKSLFASPEVRALMIGLDGGGKTSLLYRWKLGDVVTAIPTIGFNVESIAVGRTQVTVWDIGGQDKLRPLWRHYLQSTNVVLWVVDANDKSRYADSSLELDKIIANEELKDARLIVVANKMDLPGAGSIEDIQNALHLADYIPNHKMKIFPVCAVTGDGMDVVMREAAECGAFKPEVGNEEITRFLVNTLDTEVEQISTTYGIPLPDRSCAIGPKAIKLPPETLGNIFSFVDVSCLVPRLLLSCEVYLVNKVFAYHSLRELATRIAMAVLTPPPDMCFRSLFYLSVPRSLIPLHIYVLAIMAHREVYVHKSGRKEQKCLLDLLNAADGINVFPTSGLAPLTLMYRTQMMRLIVSTQITFEGTSSLAVMEVAMKGLEPLLHWIYGQKNSGRMEVMGVFLQVLRDALRSFALSACATKGMKTFVCDSTVRKQQEGMFSQAFALSQQEEAVIRYREKSFTTFVGVKVAERVYMALVDELALGSQSSLTTYKIAVPPDVDLTPALLKFLRQSTVCVKTDPRLSITVEMKGREPEVYVALFGQGGWRESAESAYTIGVEPLPSENQSSENQEEIDDLTKLW
eukprot:PhF_6_TR37849/c0_g1_i1/m.56361